MDLEQLENEMRSCYKCEKIFHGRFVNPLLKLNPLKARPVFAGANNAPIMLIGQAPGIREYEMGQAFQGQAGSSIRDIFAASGVSPSSFDSLVYQTSITKCFPGRKISKKKVKELCERILVEVDRVPVASEIKNCLPYLKSQIELIKPQVIVPLGSFAIKGYLQIYGRQYSGQMVDYVGRSEDWNGSSIIFFPHTSGNSRWLNNEKNRLLFNKAKQLLAEVLKARKITF
ncbi:uracil-DNA glycosylase [Botryobacter ruber]|uniref:uracil-DNA glycosylase n=1 Tax=Botryobacter ruber TaxID=2171629 RepID=UPI000E0BFB4E|nr:uracil-DNA glycosylase family protein [Botryobacter ruber]